MQTRTSTPNHKLKPANKMQYKQNPIKKLENVRNREKFLQSAKDKFTPKPYYDKYKSLYQSAIITKWFTPLLSVITGGTFLYFLLSLQMHFVLACILGFSAVVLIELLKAQSLNLLFTSLFTEKRAAFFLIPLALLFSFGSIYLSIQGINTLNSLKDSNEISLQTSHHDLIIDSVRNHYNSAISQEQKNLQEFKASASYRGKINIHNKAIKATILQSGEHIERLRSEQAEKLKALNDNKVSSLAGLVVDNNLNNSAFLTLVVSIEIIIIFVNYWIVFFGYKTVGEYELVNTSKSTNSYSINDLQYLIDTYKEQAHERTIPLQAPLYNQVGFTPSQQGNKGTEDNTTNDKMQRIIYAIKNGETDVRKLCGYGFNPTQVKELREQYQPKN